MRSDDFRSLDPIRHGAYLCLNLERASRDQGIAVAALATRFGLRNEFEPGDDHPSEAIAFLRRVNTVAAELEDNALLGTGAIVHVAAPEADRVSTLCAGLAELLGPAITRVLAGVVRPPSFTGNAMHNFAYAHRALQQPAAAMPNAFLVPMNKTAAWWNKDWMERHTYFLPRFDETGRQQSAGHALAAAEGIDVLMRRTYKNPSEPAPPGSYDFVNYFECADDAVPTFHRVCAALRDERQNPEWIYVREGPTWHGRRVSGWSALYS